MAVDWNRRVVGSLTAKQAALGGGALVVLYVLYKRRQAAAAAAAGGTSTTGASPSLDTGTYEAGYGAGYSAGGGVGSSPATGTTPGTIIPSPTDVVGGASPATITGNPAPTGTGSSSTGAGPAVGAGASNQYSLGQVVNAASGERIVSQAFSPLYGWLNVTNLGGVYTGGGGTPGQSISKLPYGGSYLGYVAQRFGVGTPAAKQEQALHGSFGQNAISITPGGGYQLMNTKGEKYAA